MTPHLLGRCVTEEQRQLRNLQMSASGNAALQDRIRLKVCVGPKHQM
ncbi:MAG: hypothetical protein JKY55_06025 [Aliivibrio sp.]|nr:hypothetical protein [Aliivibrio sp.]